MKENVVGWPGAKPSAFNPSAPRVPNAHLFDAGGRPMLLGVEQGRVHGIDPTLCETLDRTMAYGDADRVGLFMAMAGLAEGSTPVEPPPTSVPVHALSLAVAQKCNLGCTYCYAQQGNFGRADNSMSVEVAKAAVDRLLREAAPGARLTLAYLGGEPLANRPVLQSTTQYAAGQAALAGIDIAFALTTNATLLTADDADFFERYGFTVTVSIDGIGDVHDSLRPFKSGQGSYERVVERSKHLLSRSPRRCHVAARVTVTPRNLFLPQTLDALVGLGFDGVAFSPVLSSPAGSDQMSGREFEAMLAQMIACSQEFERRLADGEVYPFSNIINTLRQIHQGNRETYPCGAGGGYLGVSAKGELFACHRFVDDDLGAMGSVFDGVDKARQQQWLADRNVHAQEPCRSCWARYLCSGGCHYEVIRKGRPACDYIRGWLHYCLGVYGTLVQGDRALLDKVLRPRQAASRQTQ
jgi:uncharacterized protein